MGRRWRTVHGYTHSLGAEEAEERGEYPISRAVEQVYNDLECKKQGISRRRVREFLVAHCACGFHHVAGPSVREVSYYSTVLTDDQKRDLLAVRPR